jgi:hypothetical protein
MGIARRSPVLPARHRGEETDTEQMSVWDGGKCYEQHSRRRVGRSDWVSKSSPAVHPEHWV